MKQLTEVVFILDRSGSMNGLEKDTIGGLPNKKMAKVMCWFPQFFLMTDAKCFMTVCPFKKLNL